VLCDALFSKARALTLVRRIRQQNLALV